jgi:hypothetical protein
VRPFCLLAEGAFRFLIDLFGAMPPDDDFEYDLASMPIPADITLHTRMRPNGCEVDRISVDAVLAAAIALSEIADWYDANIPFHQAWMSVFYALSRTPAPDEYDLKTLATQHDLGSLARDVQEKGRIYAIQYLIRWAENDGLSVNHTQFPQIL